MHKLIFGSLLFAQVAAAQPTPGPWIEPPGPFTEKKTQIYYEDNKGNVTTYVYDSSIYPCLNAAPQVPVYIGGIVGGQSATDAAVGNIAQQRMATDYHPGTDDLIQISTVPVPDWGLIKRVPRLGVQIGAVGHYAYTYGCNPMSPNNCIPRWCNIVNTMRWQLEYGLFVIYDELKADVGVDALYIRESDYPANSTQAQDLTAAKAKWMSFPADIGAVLRLGLDVKTNVADVGDTCGAKADFNFASASFWLDANPAAISYNNSNDVLWMHEMSHKIFRAPHTQCLWINGAPVEQCNDNGFCFAGNTVCPPIGGVSLMGYCIWYCGDISPGVFEHITYGEAAEKAELRAHILDSPCYYSEAACQINPNAGGGLWLFIPVLGLLAWRRWQS